MLVEKHGGRLVIESVPERGTSVTVVLPAWRVQRQACEPVMHLAIAGT